MMGPACRGGRGGAIHRAIEAILPTDHLLRRIDQCLDMSELRQALTGHYSARGRPSIDPELLIRMTLIGRIYAITSERRLCEELCYNLAYRWFCRLRPGDKVPHHSTFSKNRHGRFRDAGVFRILFESTVRRCISEGLIGGKDAAIDASFIAADASWQRKTVPGYLPYVANASRAVREWVQDTGDAVWEMARSKSCQGVSRTDPAAAWSARTVRGRFGYALNTLIDTPSGVALDVQATPARFAEEVDAGRVMLERSADRFDYHPKRVAADKAYGSAVFLGFVRDHGAIPHIPVIDRTHQTNGKLPRTAFSYDRDTDSFTCPTGKPLRHHAFHPPTGVHRYAADARDCAACVLRKKCTTARRRTLTRLDDEDVRDLARAEAQTGLYKRSMRLRRGVERFFADAKGKHGMRRLHLRGIRGAEEEFLIGAAVMNLMILARPRRLIGKPRRGVCVPAALTSATISARSIEHDVIVPPFRRYT
ncbi:transposase [Sphingomonas aurantiaca]|uniref:Transposase n=1 Tax=Sphingomonas aurantiaca TaxID=185949 RepID=A0A5E8AGL4_9SPHN|nr:MULTISPECIES: IS1182 family transposase [Sphingomonas]MBB3589487.1 transposase [Sphingomonas sp. BK481]VVT30486.1 transposase [Sphingomonas aurantiaca]